MFQGHRVILKSRVQVGLGEVAGVARLREEAQIRQLQLRDNPCNGFDRGKIGLPLQMGMDEHQPQQQESDPEQD